MGYAKQGSGPAVRVSPMKPVGGGSNKTESLPGSGLDNLSSSDHTGVIIGQGAKKKTIKMKRSRDSLSPGVIQQ